MVQFRLGRISVRVQAAFVFTILILGIGAERLSSFVTWCIIATTSVLLHELGHAFAGRAFGLNATIELHALGGQTSLHPPHVPGAPIEPVLRDASGRIESPVRTRPMREIAISLAGPLVTLSMAVIMAIVSSQLTKRGGPGWALDAAKLGVWVNLAWGLFNMLPVLPLDGGRVMTAILVALRAKDAERKAMLASMSLGIALGMACLAAKFFVGAVLMFLFAWRNFQARAITQALRSEGDLLIDLAAGRRAMEARDGRTMIAVAEAVLARSRTTEVRGEALRLLAYGRFLEGHWSSLLRLVDEMGGELGEGELAKLADAAIEVGRSEEAAQIRAAIRAPQGVNRA